MTKLIKTIKKSKGAHTVMLSVALAVLSYAIGKDTGYSQGVADGTKYGMALYASGRVSITMNGGAVVYEYYIPSDRDSILNFVKEHGYIQGKESITSR